jgi:hypothetical protein
MSNLHVSLMNLFEPVYRLLDQPLVILIIQNLAKHFLAELLNNLPGLPPELILGIDFFPLDIGLKAYLHLLNLFTVLVFNFFGVGLGLPDALINDFPALSFCIRQFAAIFIQYLLSLFTCFFGVVNFFLYMILPGL